MKVRLMFCFTVAAVLFSLLFTGCGGGVQSSGNSPVNNNTNNNGGGNNNSNSGTRHMQIGVNLWNIGWDGSQNYFKSGVNWATETNPWNPKLLADLAQVNGPIRFMDFDEANSNVIVDWKDRIQKTEDHYKVVTQGHPVPVATWVQPYWDNYSGTTGQTSVMHYGIAYEWMIDLCNRTGRDMWINVPPFASNDYWTQLATLIRNNLDPKLKVYVEYSNETWNWISLARDYSMTMGAQMHIPDAPHDVVSPSPSQWYLGPAWSVWQSLNVFKAFVDVFGANNTGLDKRLVRVIAFSENSDRTARVPIGNIVFNGAPDYGGTPDLTLNATWNPYKMVPDMLAFAPYIGPSDNTDPNYADIDGAAPDAQAKFHADIVDGMAHAWSDYRAVGTLYGIPMGTYEGGNQLSKNADVFNLSPAIYAEYTYFLDQIDSMDLVMFTHYTLYGAYSSSSAWGLKQNADTADTKAASPKWQAIKDWLAAHK